MSLSAALPWVPSFFRSFFWNMIFVAWEKSPSSETGQLYGCLGGSLKSVAFARFESDSIDEVRVTAEGAAARVFKSSSVEIRELGLDSAMAGSEMYG